MTTSLTSKGQDTIPKRIRDALQLRPGNPVNFSVQGWSLLTRDARRFRTYFPSLEVLAP
jgi:AbrB family looped-hinge helix DNA binding protein